MSGVLFVGPLDRVLFLRTLPVLESLGPAELAAIAQHARERVFAPGAYLQTRGQMADSVHLILRGEVEVTGTNGRARTLVPGEAVGFLNLLSRSPGGLEARAKVETVSLELDWEAQLDVCEEHFPVLMRYVAFLCERIVEESRSIQMRGAGSTVAQMPVRGDEPLTFVERLAALSHSGAFSTRCLDALAELAHHVTEVRWQAGEEIWKVAAAAEHFLLPVAGRIRAQVPGAGSVTFHPGATVGMHEALGGRARWYGAHSDAATRALRIEVEPFVDILEDHFDLALDFLAVLAGRLLALQRPAEAA